MINVIGLGLNLKVWKYGLFFADSIANVLGTLFLILDFHIGNKIYIFELNTLFIQNLPKRTSSENIDENISGEITKNG